MTSEHFTKSRYIAGLQCLRRLWLTDHDPAPYEELGQPIRTVVLVERKGFGDVQQLGFGQSDQRTSEQRTER